MFHIIGQLLVGLLIGAIARLILPGKEAIVAGPVGWLITALIGMGGAFIGTFIGKAMSKGDDYKAGWLMSILGAVLLTLVVRFIT
jgi:uncharacterized membrane protein YeaQ/YmgE (transglycosylase-associated protein family)